ncbi:hypothetical protein EUTSA_v10011092mg [Eutrema salsugineum]|uniref:Uncharacterized protein n=1 Tax=Eutrema salsugineum TaxID=72664 RepID=V4NH67_EUTSA|nr:hypothetical protein EUTSA_v10011092mg [Eutrema salsugineum]
MEEVLASRIDRSNNLQSIENLLDMLEEKGPKGIDLATLRRSERLLCTDEDMLLLPVTYTYLMMIYTRIGEKHDLRRLYVSTIWAYLRNEGVGWSWACEALEEWVSSGDMLNLVVYGNHRKLQHKNMKPEVVPIENVLASHILVSTVEYIEEFFDKLEDKGPKGIALATLRRSERLLFTDDDYKYFMEPRDYEDLMMTYRRRGEKEDLRRLWNLAKEDTTLFDVERYVFTISEFLGKKDIEGVHEVLEDWNSTGDISKLVVSGDQRKLVMKETEEMVNNMVKDHNEEEKMKRAMEVRRNGWDPKEDLVFSAYACVQYVEGTIDIESAADVLRSLEKQEPQDVMDSDRLSQKMVEAIRGGAYFGGV